MAVPLTVAAIAACERDIRREISAEAPTLPCVDYAVYVAAIDSAILHPPIPELTVISATMAESPDGRQLQSLERSAGVPDDVRADFVMKNRLRCTINVDSLPLGIPLTTLSDDSLSALVSRTHLDSAARPLALRLTENVVRLSRVGYSRDSSHALLYLDHHCGGLCGTGWRVQLRREAAGHWHVVSIETTWIA
jgi:hypothetical protein